MAANLNKVRPGDPLRIPADTWNTVIDATAAWQRRQRNIEVPDAGHRDTGSIVVKNTSGVDKARFTVLGLTSPLFLPHEALASFQAQVAIAGVTPTTDHTGKFAILLEPIPNGKLGRAAIDGVVVVRVKMNSEGDRYADVLPGNGLRLQSAAAGALSLLWVQPVAQRDDPTIAWVIGRFGGAGGTAQTWKWAKVTAVQSAMFLAKLVDDNGAPTGSDLNVNVAACTSTGVTTTPSLANELPWIQVGVELMIEYRTGRRPGWWLVGHNVTTCPGA